MEIQEISSHKGLRVFVIFSAVLLSLGFSALVLTKPITQDEGVFLTIAKYLNQGFLPYQDFFDHKPPGIYFLFASLFKLLGTNIFVPKLALIISSVFASLLMMKIGETLKKGSGWIAAGFFLFLLTQFEGYFLLAEPFLLLPLLFSLFLLFRFGSYRRYVFLAGFSLAIAVLYKQTAALSALPLLVFVYYSKRKGMPVFFAGLFLPLLLLAAYLLAHGLLAQAWQQVIVATLTEYPRESLFSVLQLLRNNFFWTLPLWALFFLGLSVRIPHKEILWALVLLPLPLMFFRHYPHYWVQLLPFVALIAAASLCELKKFRVLIVATFIFCLAITGGKVVQDFAPNSRLLKEQLGVAKALSEDPASRVLVENQFTAFYFLLPQRPLNKFLYITEITNAEGAEQTSINDLELAESVIILWPEDRNYAYAKKLQEVILRGQTETIFPILGMRVMRYASPTSQ